MNVILDTCTFLWIINNPKKLSNNAKNIFQDTRNKCFLSIISFWEIMILHSLKRINFKSNPEEMLIKKCKKENINILPLSITSIFKLDKLPQIHKDPFDRIIICQALTNNLSILTPDKEISKYSVDVIW